LANIAMALNSLIDKAAGCQGAISTVAASINCYLRLAQAETA